MSWNFIVTHLLPRWQGFNFSICSCLHFFDSIVKFVEGGEPDGGAGGACQILSLASVSAVDKFCTACMLYS